MSTNNEATTAADHPNGHESTPRRVSVATPEERFRLVAENASDVVLLVGPDERYSWASPSMSEVLGWDPSQVVGRSISDFVGAEDIAAIVAARPTGEQQRYAVEKERWLCADGSYRWMSATARQMLDEAGHLLGRVVALRDIDEQVRVRLALAQSEADYRRLAENASDVVYQTSPDGIVQWVSPSVEAALGKKPNDIVGRPMWDLFAPEDIERARGYRARVLNGEAPETFELRYLTHDGKRRWMSVRPRPLFDEAGNIIGSVVGLRNCEAEVLERRAAATLSSGTSALVRIDNKNSLLVDMCQIAVDDGGYLLAWYGRPLHDGTWRVAKVATSRDHREYVDSIELRWDDGPLAQGPAGTALRTATTSVSTDHDNSERFAPWRAQAREHGFASSVSLPVFIGDELDGVFSVYASESNAFDTHAVSLLEDLARQLGSGLQRLRNERRVIESEARYRLLAEHSSDVVCELDSDVLFTWVSPSMERVLGWAPDALIGTSAMDLLDPKGRVEMAAYAARVEAGAAPSVIEVCAITADGTSRWMSVGVRIIPGDDASGSSTVLSVRDVHAEVTARIAAMALSEGNAALALMFADQQQQMSRNHELRNALNSAAGFVDLIRLAPTDPAQVAERAAIASRSIGLAVAVASARPDSETSGLVRPNPIQIDDVVGTAISMLAPLANRQQTTLEFSGESVIGLGDERFLLQVVLNLVANAIKYAPADAVHIKLRRLTRDDGRQIVQIAVADRGPGIASHMISRLFVPGDRLGRTDDAGTGLGLPISKLLVERMGGTLEVVSTIGVGSTFTVTVPAG
ncbi:MAG: PAS domain S-box protein [Actinomycetota bacterium]